MRFDEIEDLFPLSSQTCIIYLGSNQYQVCIWPFDGTTFCRSGLHFLLFTLVTLRTFDGKNNNNVIYRVW